MISGLWTGQSVLVPLRSVMFVFHANILMLSQKVALELVY